MSVRAEILEGKIKQFVKSESGNLAFMLENNQGSMHYCFSAGLKPRFNSSDHLVLFGSYRSSNKFSVNFILNKTNNTEENLIDTKFDWTYKVSLVSAILVTCGIVLYLFYYLAFTPVDPYGNYVYSYITLIISLVYIVGPIIFLWVLTAVFSKSRKNSSKLDREILKLKEEYYSKALSTSTIKTMDTITKPNFCPNCGGKLPVEAKFCPNCGSEF